MRIFKENEIDSLVELLKENKVIAVPTDTVYGLCARIDSKVAHDNLMRAKNRPKNKLFPIMCADLEQIKEIAIVDAMAEKIINNFMPGPITIVLNAKENLDEYVNNGSKTIAVRMATSDSLKKMIKKLGCPVFMSSANQSGMPTCNTIEEIEKNCKNVSGVLEGKVSFGRSSTIVKCFDNKIVIIREGPITLNKIKEVVNKKIG